MVVFVRRTMVTILLTSAETLCSSIFIQYYIDLMMVLLLRTTTLCLVMSFFGRRPDRIKGAYYMATSCHLRLLIHRQTTNRPIKYTLLGSLIQVVVMNGHMGII